MTDAEITQLHADNWQWQQRYADLERSWFGLQKELIRVREEGAATLITLGKISDLMETANEILGIRTSP